MYLLARRVQHDGTQLRAAMGMTHQIAGLASELMGHPLSVHVGTFGPTVGSVIYSMVVPDLATLEQAGDKLMASGEYLELVEHASTLSLGPATDTLIQILHGGPDGDAAPANYVTTVRGRAANGRIRDAIAYGIEIVDLAKEISGQGGSFGTILGGAYAELIFLTPAADIEAFEANRNTVYGDPRFLELVDRAGAAFADEAAQETWRRLI